jgi:hypothetical protein
MWQKLAFKIFLLFFTVSLLLVSILVYNNYVHEKNQIEQTAQNRVKQITLDTMAQIDTKLDQLLSIANVLANDIRTGKLPQSQIINELEKTMEVTPHLFGIGVAYIPYINNPQERRQSHYYINKKGSLQIEEENPIQLFITPCSYNDLTKYGRMPTCVVFIEYSLNDIKSLMKNIDVGKTGYRFLLSKEGVFLNHPLEKEVKDRETIFEQAELRNGAFKMLGEHDVIDYVDERTGQSAWIFYQTIPTTGWIMGTLVVKNEILSKTTELEHKLIKIGLWFLAALIVFFLALLFRAYEGERFRFWIVVLSATVLLLVSLEFVWSIVQTSPKGNESKIVKSTIIVDKAGLHQLISANTSSKASPNYIIPTGVSIESIKFAENKAIIKGHIWQKYPDDIHEEITRGFILPDVLSPTITEESRHKENKTEEIKWFFEGPLRQQFDNSKYPFDKREISLLIHHVDKNVYLIPDLEAYHSLKPSILPGIKSDLIIPDWLMKSSFFNYQVHQSGIDVENKVENFSNLYFTISAQRDFLKPFIYSVLPLIVVGIMLFVILLLLGRVGSFGNIIAPLLALFIGVILAHIGLRKEIVAPDILFIEYYYLVTYVAILAVIASYFLFHNNNLRFIQYRNGLVVKLLFLPLTLISILGITIWVFYT